MASKRKQRRKVCGTKVKYPTVESAKRVVFFLAKKDSSNNYLNVYKCPFCKAYHIGHSGIRRRA